MQVLANSVVVMVLQYVSDLAWRIRMAELCGLPSHRVHWKSDTTEVTRQQQQH